MTEEGMKAFDSVNAYKKINYPLIIRKILIMGKYYNQSASCQCYILIYA